MIIIIIYFLKPKKFCLFFLRLSIKFLISNSINEKQIPVIFPKFTTTFHFKKNNG